MIIYHSEALLIENKEGKDKQELMKKLKKNPDNVAKKLTDQE